MANKKPMRPYVVVFTRAACPEDHIAFELGARNANKAARAAKWMIKGDKELDKLGLLCHRATLRIVGEYDPDSGGEALALGDTDDMSDLTFEELYRMCDIWTIDRDSLNRVAAEDIDTIMGPATKAAAKPKESSTTTKKDSKPLTCPFPASVVEQIAARTQRHEYYLNERLTEVKRNAK
jgi:hypothetical protein